jgi:hypothetical protein
MDYPLPKRGVLMGVLNMEYIHFVPSGISMGDEMNV